MDRKCGDGSRADRALHPRRSGCRPPHVGRLPDPHAQADPAAASLRAGAGNAADSDGGIGRGRVRRVVGGQRSRASATRARRSAGRGEPRRGAPRPTVRHQRPAAVRSGSKRADGSPSSRKWNATHSSILPSQARSQRSRAGIDGRESCRSRPPSTGSSRTPVTSRSRRRRRRAWRRVICFTPWIGSGRWLSVAAISQTPLKRWTTISRPPVTSSRCRSSPAERISSG